MDPNEVKRSVTDLFKRADDLLDGQKMAEKAARGIRHGKADWSKDEDVAFSESVDRAAVARRERPRDGKCPNCREYVEGRWVYEGKGAPMCWGCWQAGPSWQGRGRPVRGDEHGPMRDGNWVYKCRAIRRWSRLTVGKKIGKSMAWVQRVEGGSILLTEELQDRLEAIFSAP